VPKPEVAPQTIIETESRQNLPFARLTMERFTIASVRSLPSYERMLHAAWILEFTGIVQFDWFWETF
jgi:hypothetical protein